MRSLFLGLAAIACLTLNLGGVAHAQAPAAAPAAATPQTSFDKGMQMAPAIITAAQIPCTPTAANFLFTGDATVGETKVAADFVEVACENNLGYVLASHKDGSGASAYDCLATHGTVAEGQNHPLRCTLPANTDPAKSLQPVVEAAGVACDVQNGRAVGMTATATYYELSCKDADGLFVGLENPRTSGKLQINTCYQRMDTSAPCTLTTKEQSLAPIMALASKGDKPCAATQQRYVARDSSGVAFYEFACPDGTGFIVVTTANGEFARAIPCPMAMEIAGGCTLTKFVPATQSAAGGDRDSYTALAKKAGFNCDVSRFGVFPAKQGGPAGKVIELACSNRPDGGIGYFGGDKDVVVSCLQGRAQGYKCSYTKEELGFPVLTAALKAKGRSSCAITSARSVGFSPDEDFIEVGCGDGLPGWVIAFAARQNVVTDVLTCGQADGIAGGCQLPSNTKK